MSTSTMVYSQGVGVLCQLAGREARKRNHQFVGTEHILLGLCETKGQAVWALTSLGVDLSKIRASVDFIIGHTGDIEKRPQGKIGFSPRAKKVIELAINEAQRMGHHCLGTHHLLIGLLLENESMGGSVLENLGVKVDKVRQLLWLGTIPEDRGFDPPLSPSIEGKLQLRRLIEIKKGQGNSHNTKNRVLRRLINAARVAGVSPQEITAAPREKKDDRLDKSRVIAFVGELIHHTEDVMSEDDFQHWIAWIEDMMKYRYLEIA